jgi:hypothetical protein
MKRKLEGRALVHDEFRFTLKMSGTRKKPTPLFMHGSASGEVAQSYFGNMSHITEFS